jgi:hypothetical protein
MLLVMVTNKYSTLSTTTTTTTTTKKVIIIAIEIFLNIENKIYNAIRNEF